MRALLPRPDEHPDLHEHYATGWADGGVRVNFVTAVDGSITDGGTSRGLQTAGDQAAFRVLRDLADVVLVGRGTAVAEGYPALAPGPARVATRRRFGLGPRLPTAVVTAGADLDPRGPLFDYRAGAARTIVLTTASADTERLAEVADVVVCGERLVDLRTALDALRERGLHRILCEGGPQLFTGLLAVDAVDELCLTTVPRLAGGPGSLVTAPLERAMELVGLCEDEGTLLARYRLGRRS